MFACEKERARKVRKELCCDVVPQLCLCCLDEIRLVLCVARCYVARVLMTILVTTLRGIPPGPIRSDRVSNVGNTAPSTPRVFISLFGVCWTSELSFSVHNFTCRRSIWILAASASLFRIETGRDITGQRSES